MRSVSAFIIIFFGISVSVYSQSQQQTLIQGLAPHMSVSAVWLDSLTGYLPTLHRAGFNAVWLPVLPTDTPRFSRSPLMSSEPGVLLDEIGAVSVPDTISDADLMALSATESVLDGLITHGLNLFTGTSAPDISDTVQIADFRFDMELARAYQQMESGDNGYDIRVWHQFSTDTRGGQAHTLRFTHPDLIAAQGSSLPEKPALTANPHKRMLSYAHLLMTPGTAVILWSDYTSGSMDALNRLVQIRKQFAWGSTFVRTSASDENDPNSPYWTCQDEHGPECADTDRKQVLVVQRTGVDDETGVVLAINKHSDYYIQVWVTLTGWEGKRLYDITGNTPDTISVQSDGRVHIPTRASNYHVFVPVGFQLHEDDNYTFNWEPPGETQRVDNAVWIPEFRVRNGSIFSKKDLSMVLNVHFQDSLLYSDTLYIDFMKPGDDLLMRADTVTLPVYGRFEGTLEWLTLTGDKPELLLERTIEFTEPVTGEEITEPVIEEAPVAGYADAQPNPLSADVRFSWSYIQAAGFYELELSTDTLWVENSRLITVSDTAHTESNLTENTRYYWRVRALNDSGAGPWSEIRYVTTPGLPAVENMDNTAPSHTELLQNFPNPFNPATIIRFNVAHEVHIRLEVYDLIGRRVALLVDDVRAPGRYDAVFNSDNLPSGVYLSRMESGGAVFVKKMTLVK